MAKRGVKPSVLYPLLLSIHLATYKASPTHELRARSKESDFGDESFDADEVLPAGQGVLRRQ